MCERSNKKTISPEHVLEALKELGFEGYLEEVRQEYQEQQTQARDKDRTRSATKMEASGLTEEELQAQQEALFERARQRMAAAADPEQ